MLRSNTRCKAIGSAKCDITWLYSTGHVVCFGGRIDNLVNGLHGEVKGHEFTLEKPTIRSPR